jgi:hypothetical protein
VNRKFLKRFDNYLVFGVGVNDLPEHKTKWQSEQGSVERCEYYIKWHSMLRRCYSEVLHRNNPAYKGCIVCEEWKYFSNFKAWMEQQDWEGKDLDKDWRVLGNKEYSPETCAFIDGKLNSFLCNSLYGVDFHKKTGKFRARVSDTFVGKTIHLGLFATYKEADLAYVKAKISLAEKWAQLTPEYSKLIHNFVLQLLQQRSLTNEETKQTSLR